MSFFCNFFSGISVLKAQIFLQSQLDFLFSSSGLCDDQSFAAYSSSYQLPSALGSWKLSFWAQSSPIALCHQILTLIQKHRTSMNFLTQLLSCSVLGPVAASKCLHTGRFPPSLPSPISVIFVEHLLYARHCVRMLQ